MLPSPKRAKAKLLTFIRLVDLVQAVVTEAGIYPPGAENWQGKRTRHIARRLEFPAVVARVCEKNIDFKEKSMKNILEQLDLRSLLHFI